MEKTTENKNQQAGSRAVAENTAQRKKGSGGALEFVDNRPLTSTEKLFSGNFDQREEGGNGLVSFVDNRPESAAQLRMAEMMRNSPQAKQAAQMKAIMQNSSHHAAQNRMADIIRGTAQREEMGEEEVQRKAEPVQRKENTSTSSVQATQLKENKTGMPDNLKSGLENLSGMNMDHVKVHYNSPEPAQLNAHAFTQGSDIHVASGQEKHIAHEGWHVVQQAEGRVQPTMQMSGTQINGDAGLEKEADVMGGGGSFCRAAGGAEG